MTLLNKITSRLFSSYQDLLAQLAHFGCGGVLTTIIASVARHLFIGTSAILVFAFCKEIVLEHYIEKAHPTLKGAARDFAYFVIGISAVTACLWGYLPH